MISSVPIGQMHGSEEIRGFHFSIICIEFIAEQKQPIQCDVNLKQETPKMQKKNEWAKF